MEQVVEIHTLAVIKDIFTSNFYIHSGTRTIPIKVMTMSHWWRAFFARLVFSCIQVRVGSSKHLCKYN